MKLNIALLPGDGIGPEIMTQALKATKAVCEKFGHTLTYKEAIVGARAIDETGDPYPAATHELCMQSDAVLFGAIGDPKYDNDPNAKVRPEQGLLAIRKALGLYANLRPVGVHPALAAAVFDVFALPVALPPHGRLRSARAAMVHHAVGGVTRADRMPAAGPGWCSPARRVARHRRLMPWAR